MLRSFFSQTGIDPVGAASRRESIALERAPAEISNMFGWIHFIACEREQRRFIQLHYMQPQKGGENG
jgi:hypothetical protein